jgi:hypothetical protein
LGRCGRRWYSGSNQSLRERPRRPSRAGSLGSSGPGGGGLARAHHPNQQGRKGDLLSEASVGIPDCGGCNALPKRKHDCPQPWGKRVGGVSGEPMGVHEEERSSHVLRSQRWKALRFATRSSAFAGGRYRVSLGRSGRLQRARSSAGGSHRRQRVSSGRKRRGTLSACDKASRTLLGSRPTSTFGFRGHVLRSIQRPVQRQSWDCPCSIFAIAVGQAYASKRNRHRG